MDMSDNQFKSLQEFAAQYEVFSSDSRNLGEGAVFVALKGEQGDGHCYVEEILQKHKHVGVVVEQLFLKNNPQYSKNKNIFTVDSTASAHRALAHIFRKRSQAKFIAVGGSAGKTSAKEFLSQLLSDEFEAVVTHKSQNGELGIPKTLEGLRPNTQLAIIEVGIDRPGDMRRHMDLLDPDWGVLTSIGEEHLLYLQDLETVFKEESILFESVWANNGFCFAPQADSYLSRYKTQKNFVSTPDKVSEIDPSWQTLLSHPLGERNAALAAAVALKMGLSSKTIQEKLLRLSLPEGRGRLIESKNIDQKIIADHYNSNPSSLRAGLLYLTKNFEGDKYLVLGDMRELGTKSADYHVQLLEEAMALSPKAICLVGSEFDKAAHKLGLKNYLSSPDSRHAAQLLKPWAGLKGVFFIKGSRGIELEYVLEIFTQVSSS